MPLRWSSVPFHQGQFMSWRSETNKVVFCNVDTDVPFVLYFSVHQHSCIAHACAKVELKWMIIFRVREEPYFINVAFLARKVACNGPLIPQSDDTAGKINRQASTQCDHHSHCDSFTVSLLHTPNGRQLATRALQGNGGGLWKMMGIPTWAPNALQCTQKAMEFSYSWIYI